MAARSIIDFSRLPVTVTGFLPYRLVRRTVEIDAERVRVTESGLFPWPPLTEPLAAFAVRRGAAMRHGRPVFAVDLLHTGHGWAIRLFRSNDEAAARKAWLDLAQAAGLRAVDETPVGPVARRNPAALTPLRHLGEAGNLAVPAPEPLRPPWPLQWRGAGDAKVRPPWPEGTTDLSLPVVGPAVVAVFALLIGLSAFLCWHGFPGGLVAMLQAVRVLYCVLTLLLLAILVLMLAERRHVAVTHRGVTLCSTWFGRRTRGATLPLDAIDTVILPARRIRLGAGSMLIVAAGRSGFAIPELTARQAGWLGRFIMAAAAGERWVHDPGAASRTSGNPAAPPAGGAQPRRGTVPGSPMQLS